MRAAAALLLDVEAEGGGADGDLVAGAEPGRGDAASVDLDPVGGAEVDDLPVAALLAPQLGVAAADVGVGEDALDRLRAPDRRPRPVEDIATVLQRDDSAGGDQRADRLLGPLRPAAVALAHRRVDHRVPLFPLLRRRPLVRGRLHQPRLDPELAQPQPLVGLELDRGPGQQVVTAPPRVLQQVAGELLLERALVALEFAAVLTREEDRVLVGNVDALDRGGLVRVHFLRQFARQFDWLHLRAEGTAEDPLDEAFEHRLEATQSTDGEILGIGWPGAKGAPLRGGRESRRAWRRQRG